jgi:hypothetical protein
MGKFKASYVPLVRMFALVYSFQKEKEIVGNVISKDGGESKISSEKYNQVDRNHYKWASYYVVPLQVISWQMLQRPNLTGARLNASVTILINATCT